MRFAVLGPLEVRSSAGELLNLPRRKARELLAVLVLRADRFVAADELIDYLWGDRPPSSARANLQSYMTDLRRILGDDATRLESEHGRYRLRVDASEVDVSVFEQLAAEGHEALRNHDPALALGSLTQAAGLWRGTGVAEGLALPPELEPDVARLTETRLVAFEDGIDARLELGQHAHLEPELLPVIATYPYRERLSGQLMMVRYRCGRQADALEAFHAVRHRLDSELGIRPGDHLEQLHRRILEGDPALAAPVAPAGEPDERDGVSAIPRQLPSEPTVFVGRSAELERVLELASAPGAVVIDGMSGVGKTTLAVHAAHRLASRYPDGQLFVDFGGFTNGGVPAEPAEVLAELLRALGYVGHRIPRSLAGRAATWRSVSAERRMLLVLDNASSEAQVEPLIPAAADCCVLVTSRRRLTGLPHQSPVSLDVISGRAGVALLGEIVGADRVEPRTAEQIHTLCGGLPLAIQIAGSRMRARDSWTTETLLARLTNTHSRLTELTAGERSVTVAFNLSYGQLEDDQRWTFRILSLHPGADIGNGAAAALAGLDPATTDRVLDRLVDDHLLREDAAGRYHFHDLLREFAAQLATESQSPAQRREAVHRLVHWYLHASLAAGSRIEPWRSPLVPEPPAPAGLPVITDDESAMAWLESEWRNLVAIVSLAADHGLHTHAWQIAHAMYGYFFVRGYNEQFVATNEVALGSARRVSDPRAEAEILAKLGVAYGRSARYPEALEATRTALERFQHLGDQHRTAGVLTNLGGILWHSGRYADAVNHLGRALATARPLGDQLLVGAILNNLGELCHRAGRHDAAREHLLEALSIVESAGQARRLGVVLTGLGATVAALGEATAAREYLDRAYGLALQAGHREGEGRVQYELGMLEAVAGRHAPAIDHHHAALGVGREIGDATLETQALNGLGEAYRGAGHQVRALEHHHMALAVADRVGDPVERARGEAGIGRAMLTAGDTARARNHIARAVDLVQGLDLPETDELRNLLERLDT